MIINYVSKKNCKLQKNKKIKDSIIMLSSITYAYKARDYLQPKGISVYLLRTPPKYSPRGCGYSIRLNYDNVEEIVNELKCKGIKVLGVVEI